MIFTSRAMVAADHAALFIPHTSENDCFHLQLVIYTMVGFTQQLAGLDDHIS